MFRSIVVCAFLLFGSLPSSLAKDAQPVSRLDAIIAAGVLKVGSAGDYKPFTFKDPATGSFPASISTRPKAWRTRSV